MHQRSYSTSSPVSTGMGYRIRAGVASRYVTSQLDQLSLASIRGSGFAGVMAGMSPPTLLAWTKICETGGFEPLMER